LQIAKLILAATLVMCSVPAALAQNADPVVMMQTTRGNIVIRVYRGLVPVTANNFLDLVGRGFYNGLTFHRIETWCIQGGDPNGDGSGSFVDPQTGQARYLNLEISPALHHNAPGVVAMARAQNPNSASCQFYITKAPMGQLDRQYAIFGGVVDGINVVRSIGRGDRIISAQIIENGGGGRSGGMAPQQGFQQQRRGSGTSASNAGTPTDSGF
jgi:peptidyl-prolyl cis-trans isomerase B (cyclophilin B)